MNIEEAIDSTKTMREAAIKLDIPFSTFKRKATALGLYEPNQGAKGTKKAYKGTNYINTQEILDGKQPQYKTTKLKVRLINEGIVDQKCVWCGITDTWNDKPVVLHLDHINGIHNDHRLENLRLLCPNCHSQTDTWCGRNKIKSLE